uniref:Uncharacterized protein n=1 Tax=Lygus hesperus TaxID=30085 RepID=A0A0A9ZE25_LYGHE
MSLPQAGYHNKVIKSALHLLSVPDTRRSVVLTGNSSDVFLILCGLKSEKSRVAEESSTSVPDAANQPDLDPSEDLKSADAEFQDNGCQTEPELEEKLAGAESESPSHPQQ